MLSYSKDLDIGQFIKKKTDGIMYLRISISIAVQEITEIQKNKLKEINNLVDMELKKMTLHNN